MSKKHWREKNLHHIIWQKNRRDFNVDLQTNKIIVDKIKHEALNTLMIENQDPQSQLSVMKEERWNNVLSDVAKQLLEELICMDRNEFYKKWLVKKKRPN